MAIAPRSGNTGPLPVPPASPIAATKADGDDTTIELPIEQLAVTVETLDGKTKVFLGGSPSGLAALANLCQELIKAGSPGTWIDCDRGEILAGASNADPVLFVAQNEEPPAP
jgi:hypothetical protein